MANTLPNIIVNDYEWTNIYEASGIPVGTSIVIQNQSTLNFAKVAIAPSAPSTDDFGYLIPSFPDALSSQIIDQGESGVFILAQNDTVIINVQRA